MSFQFFDPRKASESNFGNFSAPQQDQGYFQSSKLSLPEFKLNAGYQSSQPPGTSDTVKQFQDNMFWKSNDWSRKTGFVLQSSKDPLAKLRGQKMVQDSFDQVQNKFQQASELQYSAQPDVQQDTQGGTQQQDNTTITPVTGNQGGKNFKNFLSQNGSMIGGAASALNGVSDMLFGQKRGMDGPNSGLTAGIDSAYNSASDAVMQFNPMIGGAMKAAGFLGNTLNKMGGGTDGMTKVDAVMNSAPMTLMTLGLNGFLGDTTESMTKNEEAFAQVGASYGGTGSVVDDAISKAGKKYGLLSGGARTEANRAIRKAKMQQDVMAGIGDRATDSFAIQSSMAAINGNRRAFAMQGGYDQSAIRVGKQGMPIQQKDNATTISLTSPVEEFKEGGSIVTYIKLVSETEEFKEGGSINVIPDGSLHSRKHNMDLEGITPKGIPVVSEKEGGEIEQQAEIEKEEIIFRLEVTKKLEELAKDGSDDAAIEAGKLLVDEILYNTVDNTNNLL